MDNKMIVGQRVAAARELRSLKASDLASMLSITPSRLSNWENGVSGVSAEYIYLISEKLNVTSDYLIGLTDNPESRALDQDDHIRGRLMTSFIQLNTEGQSRVADYAEDLHASGNYNRQPKVIAFKEEPEEEPADIRMAAYSGDDLSDEQSAEAIRAKDKFQAKQGKGNELS
ncbi:MAG: helix-turn-helix domain-containing protein [Saccharofermentanales bacterium]